MSSKFMFFANFKETADKLPDDLRLKFYDAMTDYVFNGIEPEDVIISALITAIKPSLDKEDGRGGARDGAGAKKNNQNAKKQSITINDNNVEQSKTIKTIKNNQNNQSFLETETETEDILSPKYKNSNEFVVLSPYEGDANCSVCNRRAKFEINGERFCGQHTRIELSKYGRLDLLPRESFVKPSLDDVRSYCQERNNQVDAERWFNYYSSNGWKVGKNSMKDWRAAVRTWETSSASPVGSKATKQTDEEFYRRLEAL